MAEPSPKKPAQVAKKPPAVEPPKDRPERLISLDAYRGMVMLAMASGGLALAQVGLDPQTQNALKDTFLDSTWSGAWRFLAYQSQHVAWTGCAFWDLIQPSFMFIVGVAMPFSYGRRAAAGRSWPRNFGHALTRAMILVILGVFLASNGESRTNFLFTNVLAQIGLGYALVFLLVGRAWPIQLLVAAGVLGGYWYLFYQHPLPTPELQEAIAKLRDVPEPFVGLAAHWNKHSNYAAWFDRDVLLNLFPRSERYEFNLGGYQTLNFVPSMVTMLMGVMAGELLRGRRSPQSKTIVLLLASAGCFGVALAVDQTMWPFVDRTWTLCPAVKRIWTPTWTLFSGGWTLLMLAGFYWIIDARGYRRLAFPLVVVGMNSIVMYLMAQLIKPWLAQTLKTHLGAGAFGGHYGPLLESAAVLLALWLICYWLYRQKIFVRI